MISGHAPDGLDRGHLTLEYQPLPLVGLRRSLVSLFVGLNAPAIVRLAAEHGEQVVNQFAQVNLSLRTAMDWAQSYAALSSLYTNPLTGQQFLSVARNVLAKPEVETLGLYLPEQRDPLSLQQMANANELTDGLVEYVLRRSARPQPLRRGSGESSAGPST